MEQKTFAGLVVGLGREVDGLYSGILPDWF
jgi:hypothetical protein